MEKGFKCSHCGNYVPVDRFMGTYHRNQCPYCLWSRHVDIQKGDRKSPCKGLMEPIGLTFKKEGRDKYGRERKGELMIIHCCQDCQRISINRVAADDDPKAILAVFEKSLKTETELETELEKAGIRLLKEIDREEIRNQLFGKRD
jgi:DNA-directed RNA polymerase subunit RPC12/RpoP